MNKHHLPLFQIDFALVAVVVCLLTTTATATDIGTSSEFHEQRFEAWGTSLAWMGNELGASTSGSRREQIMDLLFDQNNGLGLNFVRYNIGAGQNPAGPAITRPGGDIDGWAPDAPTSVSDPSTWVWDWNADATQRLILNEAIERGVTQVEAFANSAPWWMTNSLSSRGIGGNNNGQANLDVDNYDVFGEYLLDVTEHFQDDLGIHFNSLAPMNEPGAGWWNGGNNQEGMNVPQGSAQSSLIREIGQQILDRGLEMGLVGPEETSIRDTLNSYDNYGTLTRSYLAQINTHSYPYRGGSDASDALALVAYNESRSDGPKKIYATEFGTGGNSTPLSGGINLANQISSDLRNLGAAGWTYWQAVEDNNGSNWGLLIAPMNGTNTWFNMRKQYYAMQHFSAYIQPGSQILNQSNDETIAAYDPRTGATVLVVTNDDDAVDSNVFTMLDKTPAFTRVIRTDASGNYRSYGPAAVSGNQITASTTAQSITTIVAYDKPNLIQNADFNLANYSNGSAVVSGWQAEGGGFYNVYNNSNTGNGSGALWTHDQANSGEVFQTGIGDVETDLTGMAFEFSLDVKFQNGGDNIYDADTYLAIEFYGADDQTLVNPASDDFQTLIIPALGIDESRGNDSDYRTFRTGRFVAPPGTRYVRPVIRYDNVDSDSNNWVFFDNAYLQEAHPAADSREWTAEGGGDWSSNSNWMNHALVEKNKRAYFGNAIKQDSTITLSSPQSVSGLTFFSEHEYQLQGTGDLTIGNPSETALVDVRDGSHRISVDTSLGGPVDVQVLPGASVSFDSSLDLNGQALTKLGAGNLDLSAGLVMNGGEISSYAVEDSLIHLGPAAILNGDFELLLAPGQTLQLGDLFQLATYSSLNDTFDNLILPPLSSSWAWDVDYGSNALTVEIVNSAIAGDFNVDGEVNGEDFLYWQRNAPPTDDLGDWQNNYGANATTAPRSNNVPEPSSLAITLVFSNCLGIRRRAGA